MPKSLCIWQWTEIKRITLTNKIFIMPIIKKQLTIEEMAQRYVELKNKDRLRSKAFRKRKKAEQEKRDQEFWSYFHNKYGNI